MKPVIIFTTLLIENSPQALPLGAACIASAVKHHPLTKDKYNVQLISFCAEDDEFKKNNTSPDAVASFLAEKLLSQSPNLVAFSMYVWNRVILEKTAEILHKKGVLTLAGGPEVTAHPEVFTVFDKVTSGEGEEKVPAIIEELFSGKPVKNPPVSVNLDTLSSPYLDGTLDPAEYEGALWELARGCPFKCSYCYESKGEKTVRLFPMKRIQAELDLFAKKKIPQVFVLDPTYNASKKRAVELIDLIAKKTPDTFYYFEARAEFLDRQMVQAFTRIPCSLQIGLQTADENVARLVNRPFQKQVFSKNIKLLNDAGVTFGLDVIYGLPGDTLRGFKESIDFAIRHYPNNLELFCLSVLPGTDLFDRAKNLHLNFEENPPYHILYTDRFSKTDIETASNIAAACSYFYNEGRAVPWFNTICKALKTKPSLFFEDFYNYFKTLPEKTRSCTNHQDIEEVQKLFVRQELTKKKLNRYINAAMDIITLNGAFSRKTDTGVTQTITLNYPVEYVDSQYAMDLDFFVKNVKMKQNKVRI